MIRFCYGANIQKNFHYQWFENACKNYGSLVKMCTFNFVNIYGKVERNFPGLEPISGMDKDEVVSNLGQIALRNHIYLQTCILQKDYPGIYNEGCITPATVGLNIKPTKSPLQNGCMCSVHTYGIGDYNTCKGGCKYCYATSYVDRTPNIMGSCLPVGDIKPSDIVEIIDKRIVDNTPNLFDFL